MAPPRTKVRLGEHHIDFEDGNPPRLEERLMNPKDPDHILGRFSIMKARHRHE